MSVIGTMMLLLLIGLVVYLMIKSREAFYQCPYKIIP